MERVRDRVLDGAELLEGMTIADVGAGEGLIAFGAIDRVGSSLRVVFTDLSAQLLKHAERLAEDRGVGAQCTFVQGSAENLAGLGDMTIDVITTRASLAYVRDKKAALKEFRRVLKPSGRISIAEPILRDGALEICALAKLIETQPAHPDIDFLRLVHRYRAALSPSTEWTIGMNPLTKYSERDLIRFVRESGFTNIHLQLHIDDNRSEAIPWEVFLDISPHPWAPTLGEILAGRFSSKERRVFEKVL